MNFWRARSKLERCLFLICLGLSLIIFILLVVIITTATNNSPIKNEWDDAQILHVSTSNSNYLQL